MVYLNCYSRTIFMKVFYELIITWHKTVMVDTDLTCTIRACRILDVGILQNDKTCAAFCTK